MKLINHKLINNTVISSIYIYMTNNNIITIHIFSMINFLIVSIIFQHTIKSGNLFKKTVFASWFV